MDKLTYESANGFTPVWSAQQQAIFGWFATGLGNLIVMARAGTGKTTTIKHAFEFAPENRMLYCVFNKKNQIEAQEKIKDPRVEVKTLHAVGFAFIKKVWSKARPDYQVETDRVDIIASREQSTVKTAIRRLVGFAKNTLINATVSDLEDICSERDIDCDDQNVSQEKLANYALQVLELSKQPDPQNRISFDDMVWLPVAMGWAKATYDLVVVDESQDMNLPQLFMARQACKPGGRVCVVGDDRQAIYNFRGAATDGMGLMKQELSAQELGLTITYRCPKSVVNIASQLVPDYVAADSAPEGTVDEMKPDALVTNAKPGDAILSRLNAPLMPLCLSFIRAGMPAKIEGRDIGKALLAIVWKLKAKSVPHFLERVESWRTTQVNRALKTRNGDKKASDINDQAETLIAVAEGATSVNDIQNKLESIFADVGNSSNVILLSSTHKAKGLEWNRVFLLADTYNRRSTNASAQALREEQNIYYVAVTRSKNHLTFVR